MSYGLFVGQLMGKGGVSYSSVREKQYFSHFWIAYKSNFNTANAF